MRILLVRIHLVMQLAISLQHGKVKDVRLVTYRSGASKGLAYVEYETEVRLASLYTLCSIHKYSYEHLSKFMLIILIAGPCSDPSIQCNTNTNG